MLFLVIAGWLTQGDFGVYRSFSLILLLLSTFATFGLDFHYISSQKKSLLNLLSLMQVGIILWLSLGIVCTLAAGWIGRLYHSPDLGLLMLASLPFLGIEILRWIYRAWAQKQLKFRELAIAETINVILYSVLAVAGLFFVRKVWLYVALFYLGNLAEAVYLIYFIPPIPRSIRSRIFSLPALQTSLANLKANAVFLANVISINVLQVYAGNAPVLFLGMMVAPQQLGLYFFASQLIGVPVGMLTGSLSQVFFPVFAAQERTVTIANIRRYTALVIWFGIPLLTGYVFALQYAIPMLMGDKWNAALPLIFYLLLFYGTSLLHHPISAIPVICRKPHWELIWNILSLIIRIGALALGIRYSYNTAVLLFCIVSAVLHLGFYFMALALLHLAPGAEIIRLLPRLLIPAFIAAALFWLQRLSLGLYLGLGILIIYFIGLIIISPRLWKDAKRLLIPS